MTLVTAKNSFDDILADVIKVDLNAQAVNNFYGKPQFYEILSRISKNGQPINPQAFILEKEKDGSIVDYDINVLTQVMLYLRRGGQKFPLSVNVSGITINQNSQQVLNILNGLEDKVIVEITETAKVEVSKAVEFSKEYQQSGGRVALDDFNTFNIESLDDVEYKIDLLNAIKPNIVKLVLPYAIQDKSPFYLMAEKTSRNLINVKFVIERIENKKQLIACNKCFKTLFKQEPWFQGFYFDKGSLLIEDIL